ncbi:MAG: LPS export ABC transporter permease LptF [Deltaproteobacteria bacterium]|nr:LPS export ABC transporter permease LptF [Deltaproteobacteria bacterium]
MLRTIDKYVFREAAVPFLLSLAILTLTALLSKVVKLIELVLTHGAGARFVFWFILSALPSFLVYTIPVSFLIGVLIAFTRLSSDSEITAMKASGISLFKLLRPVLALAVIASVSTLAFTLYLFPWGSLNLKRLMYEAAKSRLVSGIEEKTFYDRFKGVTLYVDHISPRTGEMEGVFISQTGGGEEGASGASSVFFADRGEFFPSTEDFSVYLKLRDGNIHRRADDAYHIVDFSSYTLELGFAGAAPPNEAEKSNRELYTGEMIKRIEEIKARGENPAPQVVDLHKRFALPASVFVFAFLGVPLGVQKVRSARFTGFSIALGVVLAYYAASTALEGLGNNGALNPVLSVWGSDIIFGLAGLYIFRMAAKDDPTGLLKGLMEGRFNPLSRRRRR